MLVKTTSSSRHEISIRVFHSISSELNQIGENVSHDTEEKRTPKSLESRITMQHSTAFEDDQRRNMEQRRAMIKRWAKYVRTHDDREWSRQQPRLIDSQLQSANEMAASGDTDPVRFAVVRDRIRDR